MDDKKVAAELLKLAKSLAAEESAKEAYERLEKDVEKLIKKLIVKLNKMTGDFKKEGSNDWGYPGSMGHVKELLTDLNDFLGD